MRRVSSDPRSSWQDRIYQQGLVYNDTVLPSGEVISYWSESAHYAFGAAEVDELEKVTAELWDMCIAAGDHMLEHPELCARMGIPQWAMEQIRRTWDEEPPSVYGRFDLRYDGSGPAKLFEFNADTPTSLVESAVVQWHWFEDTRHGDDQWNSVHEQLIAAWQRQLQPGTEIHFAVSSAEDSGEDLMTVVYLQETAARAGMSTRLMTVDDVGWNGAGFVDAEGRHVRRMFKLYPWEWMIHEEFAQRCMDDMARGGTIWIEPIYKMLWSNKGLLPVLWELYPDHPNLLPAYFDDPHGMDSYVSKPLLAREGANIEIVRDGQSAMSTDGDYGEEGYVYQQFDPLPDFEGNRPVLGSWLIDGEPAGMCIRESTGPITDNLSRFVPHVISG